MVKEKFIYKIWKRERKMFGGLKFWVCGFEGLSKKDDGWMTKGLIT